MVAAKSLVRGVLIVGMAGTLAQAAPMLSLATTSSNASGNATVSYAPRYTSQALGLSLATSSTSPPPPPAAPAPAPAPVVMANPAPAVLTQNVAPAVAPMAPPAPFAKAPAGQATADAFLNMGGGPFAAANEVTAGGARAWFDSPYVAQVFGGTPNPDQQRYFVDSVLSRVGHTFGVSGVPVNLTDNANLPAAHSLSVVSGTHSPLLPSAVGMTQVGGDGFTFIDQAAKAASSVDQLSWIVAHNVAHELMLAFGVKEDHDDTGQFIDSRTANWAMMVNPSSRFSESAARELLTKDFRAQGKGLALAAQLIEPAPVPEPATLALWAVAASTVAMFRARGGRKAASA